MILSHTSFSKTVFICALLSISNSPLALAASPSQNAQACNQVVQSLKDEWKKIGYQQVPPRVTDQQITGKYGHKNTRGEVLFMQDQMKLAESDCKSGNEQSAMQRVGSVQNLLDAHGSDGAVANAAMEPIK